MFARMTGKGSYRLYVFYSSCLIRVKNCRALRGLKGLVLFVCSEFISIFYYRFSFNKIIDHKPLMH